MILPLNCLDDDLLSCAAVLLYFISAIKYGQMCHYSRHNIQLLVLFCELKDMSFTPIVNNKANIKNGQVGKVS